MSTTRSTPRYAFTLIELLVVISIVAVLAGMLLPAVGAVRDAARSAECGSRLRQVGMAVLSYADDADGLLIPSLRSAWPTIPVSDGTWVKTWNWRGILESSGQFDNGTIGGNGNYVKVMGCPVVQTSDSRIIMANPKTTAFCQSGWATYGANEHLTNTGWIVGNPVMPAVGTSLSRIGRQSGVALAMDGRWNVNFYHHINYAGGGNDPNCPHRRRANVVFLDGHVGSITADQVALFNSTWTTVGSEARAFWLGSL